ncbi:MAG: S41 family peptidase [Victivallales bacterium]|jgi:carboxyl-terminal processing protease
MPFKYITNALREKNILVFAVSAILVINLVVGYSVYSSGNSEAPDEGYASIYKFMFVLQKVRNDYVDANKANYQALIKGAMKGMLRELDPFCSYMEPEGYKELVEDTEGREFGGIGIVVNSRNHMLEVIAPMEDTPAFKAGIKAGDMIMSIDNRPTSSMTLDDCIKLLKGPPGTSVTITIYRESEDTKKDLTIKRANIEVSSIKGAKVIEDGIGFLRVTQFNVPTAAQLDESLKKLKEQNIKALIIDLRGNPGGLLTSAIELCSRFLETGELVVSTEGRLPSQKQEYRSLRCDKYMNLKIGILVDGNSASASEIFAACLQDHKRAIVVGDKTFGKGSVQTIFSLPENGGAIRLTTAKYYAPSRRVIHENGVEPDIKVPVSPKTMDKIYTQRLSYSGVIKPEGPNSVRDVQLERAVEVMKGICLFSKVNGG